MIKANLEYIRSCPILKTKQRKEAWGDSLVCKLLAKQTHENMSLDLQPYVKNQNKLGTVSLALVKHPCAQQNWWSSRFTERPCLRK